MLPNAQTRSQVNPARLGVTFEGATAIVRVHSATADSIKVNVLNADNPQQVDQTVALTRIDGDIWEARTDALKVGGRYSLEADGPVGTRNGFNPQLRLIDPYAKGVVRESAREYHCIAVSDDFDWQGVEKPAIPLDQTIIYEAHPRGLTRGNEELPDDLRGTYAALGHPATIAHLQKIGVTSVELLPIHMFISEPRLMNMGLINYWGYNSINFFSPHPRYATTVSREKGPQAVIDELKTAIRELHRAGIEVILDVVYNHTAEGGSGGLTYSFRGLDNANYYRQDDSGNYHDTTGCGNSLDFSKPQVVNLVMDSLRYWTTEMQVDGYRFDLATTLARNEVNQFDANHPLLQAMQNEPLLADSKLIMEPWDVGLGGWQTGNFPDRFSEWNDRYRDSVRKFWLSDIASFRNSGNYWSGVSEIATRLAGSADIVHSDEGPLGSVNFITAHDGFCLKDLVSYNVKHNQINGESNRDGANNNYSFNHGAEGDTKDPSILAKRRKAARNLLGTLLFSAGIPMITAGDERGKTQLGNNNAYCQDSQLSWVNWKLSKNDLELEETFAHLTKLRRENPALRPNNFGSFDVLSESLERIRWFNLHGELMSDHDWTHSENRTLQRWTQHQAIDGEINDLLLIVHGSEENQKVVLPLEIQNSKYELLWDSAHPIPPTPGQFIKPAAGVTLTATSIQLYRVLPA